MKYLPGLCSMTLRGETAEGVVKIAKRLFLQGIEWSSKLHAPPGDLLRAEAIRKICHDEGVSAPSYGCYFRADDEHESVAGIVESALALGAKNIRVWAGSKASSASSEDEYEAVASRLRSFCLTAKRAGLTVGLEYHVGTLADEATGVMALIDAVGTDNLYTYWQPRPRFFDVMAAKNEIIVVNKKLSHLHVFYGDHQFEQFSLESGLNYWRDILFAAQPGEFLDPPYAFLEGVRGHSIDQLERDAAVLLRLLTEP